MTLSFWVLSKRNCDPNAKAKFPRARRHRFKRGERSEYERSPATNEASPEPKWPMDITRWPRSNVALLSWIVLPNADNKKSTWRAWRFREQLCQKISWECKVHQPSFSQGPPACAGHARALPKKVKIDQASTKCQSSSCFLRDPSQTHSHHSDDIRWREHRILLI